MHTGGAVISPLHAYPPPLQNYSERLLSTIFLQASCLHFAHVIRIPPGPVYFLTISFRDHPLVSTVNARIPSLGSLIAWGDYVLITVQILPDTSSRNDVCMLPILPCPEFLHRIVSHESRDLAAAHGAYGVHAPACGFQLAFKF